MAGVWAISPGPSFTVVSEQSALIGTSPHPSLPCQGLGACVDGPAVSPGLEWVPAPCCPSVETKVQQLSALPRLGPQGPVIPAAPGENPTACACEGRPCWRLKRYHVWRQLESSSVLSFLCLSRGTWAVSTSTNARGIRGEQGLLGVRRELPFGEFMHWRTQARLPCTSHVCPSLF